jgi:hypothetical protein
MGNYLGLLIDRSGVIRDVHKIECVHDIDAVECLRDLLAAIGGFESGEVWRDRDRIAKIISPREGRETSPSGHL